MNAPEPRICTLSRVSGGSMGATRFQPFTAAHGALTIKTLSVNSGKFAVPAHSMR